MSNFLFYHMMGCIFRKKCRWCKKRKSKEELWEIDIWCKYYGMYICNECYDNKVNKSQ